MEDLTQGELKKLFHYDPSSGLFFRLTTKKKVGSVSPYGYLRVSIHKKRYMAHRLAWLYVYGEWPDESLDHINRDKLDNRISNLRKANRTQQSVNSAPRRDNTSGYKGVAWFRRDGCWRAYSAEKGKQIHLGYHDTKEEAYAAYCEFVKQRHGEFAHTPETKE